MSDLVKMSVGASIEAATKLGALLHKSNMFGCKSPEQGAVLAMTCIIENLTPIEFKRKYHIIDGTPCERPDSLLARFKKAGGRFKILERSTTLCSIEYDWEGQVTIFDFTWDQAKTAGLVGKDNWKKYPENMLYARNVGNYVRTYCPELAAGIYTPEEMMDIKDVDAVISTPEPSPSTESSLERGSNGKVTRALPAKKKKDTKKKQKAKPDRWGDFMSHEVATFTNQKETFVKGQPYIEIGMPDLVKLLDFWTGEKGKKDVSEFRKLEAAKHLGSIQEALSVGKRLEEDAIAVASEIDPETM